MCIRDRIYSGPFSSVRHFWSDVTKEVVLNLHILQLGLWVSPKRHFCAIFDSVGWSASRPHPRVYLSHAYRRMTTHKQRSWKSRVAAYLNWLHNAILHCCLGYKLFHLPRVLVCWNKIYTIPLSIPENEINLKRQIPVSYTHLDVYKRQPIS